MVQPDIPELGERPDVSTCLPNSADFGRQLVEVASFGASLANMRPNWPDLVEAGPNS